MKWFAYVIALVCLATLIFAVLYPNITTRPLCLTEPNKFVVALEVVLMVWAGAILAKQFIIEVKNA